MSTEILPLNMGTYAPTVILDNDMIWQDEYAWSPMLCQVSDTVDGGIAVMEAVRPYFFSGADERGRPMTLEATDNMGWQKKSTADALHSLQKYPGGYLRVTIVSDSRTVQKYCRLRHEESPAVEFVPITEMNNVTPDDFWYKGKIKMVVVDPSDYQI